MPELPEVETVKESLKLRLNNKKILELEFYGIILLHILVKRNLLKRLLIKVLMMLKEEVNSCCLI